MTLTCAPTLTPRNPSWPEGPSARTRSPRYSSADTGGESPTEVAAALGVDRKTVERYASDAVAAGIRPGDPPMSTAAWADLIALSHPLISEPRLRRRTWPEFDRHHDLIRELRGEGQALELIWRRLRTEYEVRASIASFNRWGAENLLDFR